MEDRAEVDPATTRAPQTKRWARGHDKENFDPVTTSSVTVTAQDEQGLGMAKFIIDDHLSRFAFRETPELKWAETATG